MFYFSTIIFVCTCINMLLNMSIAMLNSSYFSDDLLKVENNSQVRVLGCRTSRLNSYNRERDLYFAIYRLQYNDIISTDIIP